MPSAPLAFGDRPLSKGDRARSREAIKGYDDSNDLLWRLDKEAAWTIESRKPRFRLSDARVQTTVSVKSLGNETARPIPGDTNHFVIPLAIQVLLKIVQGEGIGQIASLIKVLLVWTRTHIVHEGQGGHDHQRSRFLSTACALGRDYMPWRTSSFLHVMPYANATRLVPTRAMSECGDGVDAGTAFPTKRLSPPDHGIQWPTPGNHRSSRVQ
jgi:hypothetical protein